MDAPRASSGRWPLLARRPVGTAPLLRRDAFPSMERSGEGGQLVIAQQETHLRGCQGCLSQQSSGGGMADFGEKSLVARPQLGEATLEASRSNPELRGDAGDAGAL